MNSLEPEKSPSPSQSIVAALLLVQFLFGMNYLFSKTVLENFPPLLWAAIRTVTTAFVLICYAGVSGRLHLKRGIYYYRQLILFGFLGVALSQGSFLFGLKLTTATNSALLNTLIPVLTILIVALRGQESISLSRGIGFLFAFCGVLLFHRPENFSISDESFMGDLFILISAISTSLFLVYGHRFLMRVDYIWATTWLFIYGALILSLIAVPEFRSFQWRPLSPTVWTCLVITVLGGTVLPYLLMSFTLSQAPSSMVALFIYIQPIVAAITGYFFFGDSISGRTLLSGALIFSGVFLALWQRRLQPQSSKESRPKLRIVK